MNIAKVTYEDKEAIQNDETIAEKNKVTANNMNQIKKAINDNADFLTEVKNTVDELNGDVGNIKIVQTAQNSTISNMNNAIEQNSEEIYENANNIIALQKENTALKEELERQKEDNRLNGLTEDNEGELLHIINTTGARFNSLEIFGNEKQKTREGYNKLENHLQSQTINGVNIVINSDKSITLNGTATAFFQLILLDTDDTPIILSPKTYTMSLKGKILGINFVGTENGVDVPYLASTVTTESVQKTYQNETTITKILCAISQGTQLNNVKLYAMIYEGTDEKEYEEYGAMPSFDCPSEIKTVGSNINEFDKDNVNTLNAYFSPAQTTIASNSTTKMFYVPCDKNTTYTVSKVSSKRFGIGFTNDTPAVDSKINNAIENLNGVTSLTQTSTSQSKYLCVYYYKSDVDTLTEQEILDSIKIEEGNKVSSYSPYKKGSLKLKIQNNNIYDVKDVRAKPDNPIVDENDFITMSYNNSQGASTHYVNYFTNKNDYLKPDTKYYGVLEIKSVSGKGSVFVNGQNVREAQTDARLEFNLQNLSNNSKKLFEFTTLKEEEFYNCKIMFRTYLMTSVGQSATVSFRISVFEEQQDLDTFVYQKHEEQSFVMPVQQKMFTGDGFVKVNGLWKEMHSFKEIKLSEAVFLKTDNSQQSDTILRFTASFTDGNLVMYNRSDSRTFWSDKSECVYILDAYQKECLAPHNSATNQLNVFISKNRLTNETVEAFKQYLVQNEIIVYYKLLKPLYLDCTKEQIEILDKIEKEAHTYKEVTNVYTEDEVGAILKTNTNVDLKSLINNIQEQLIAE